MFHRSLFPARLIGVVISALATTAASAATSPDAGALQQQIEQGLKPATAPQEVQHLGPAKDIGPAQAGALTVTVRRFAFVGNHLLTVDVDVNLMAGSSVGTLPVGVLGASIRGAGVRFEQNGSQSIRLSMSEATTGIAPVDARGVEGTYTLFAVGGANDEMVEFQAALIGHRVVIAASSDLARRMLTTEMPLVLASAITLLSTRQPIVLAELDAIVLDMR